MKVMMTILECTPFFIPPSILSSIVFCVKGNIFRKSIHARKSRMNTRGTMMSIHCPKPIPRFKPSGSFKYFKAIVFGGVPIGVPIPPRLAAIGIDRASAIHPFPSGGNWRNTGVRNVSIIAAVAVLETNIENKPVMRRKPSNTLLLFFPNGTRSTFAN